ncbi:MAG: glycosyltransferase, partial [Clostridiaceae bacterium]
MKGISVVAPLFNEEGNVLELHRQIKAVLEETGLPYEIIFVDDGSKDKTIELAKTLVPLKLICLRRNFG